MASDVTHWPEYDYVLVNKDFEASVAAVRAILAAERLRRKRQPGLTDFVEQFRHAVPWLTDWALVCQMFHCLQTVVSIG